MSLSSVGYHKLKLSNVPSSVASKCVKYIILRLHIREDINGKKRCLSGVAPMRELGSTHARIFWPFFQEVLFLVNKKSLFLQKFQCIVLLTVFRLLIYLPPLPTFLQTFLTSKKKDSVAQIGVRG